MRYVDTSVFRSTPNACVVTTTPQTSTTHKPHGGRDQHYHPHRIDRTLQCNCMCERLLMSYVTSSSVFEFVGARCCRCAASVCPSFCSLSSVFLCPVLSCPVPVLWWEVCESPGMLRPMCKCVLYMLSVCCVCWVVDGKSTETSRSHRLF